MFMDSTMGHISSEAPHWTKEPDIFSFYTNIRMEMQKRDARGFYKSYLDSFVQEHMNGVIYNYPVEVSGAVTDVRETAASDILEYMMSNGILKRGDIDSIYLDRSLPDGVLGRTVANGYSDEVSVSYLPKIFDRSYKDVRDPVISKAIKYIQARTLKHENVHEEMLESPDAYSVVRNLGEMNYSEDVFKGLLEGMAELETEKSFYNTKDTTFGDKVHAESPYLKQLRIVEKIEEKFRFNDTERVYRGAQGFYEALAKGLLDKATVNDMLEGIELKSDFMPVYNASKACGKCGYGSIGNCGTSKHA